MSIVRRPDRSAAVRFALTSCTLEGTEVEIVLELFRGTMPLSRTVLAQVEAREASGVVGRCRRRLEEKGLAAAAEVLAPALRVPVPAPDPRLGLPVAAFDWMFEAG